MIFVCFWNRDLLQSFSRKIFMDETVSKVVCLAAQEDGDETSQKIQTESDTKSDGDCRQIHGNLHTCWVVIKLTYSLMFINSQDLRKNVIPDLIGNP